jgi:hypothetical protein
MVLLARIAIVVDPFEFTNTGDAPLVIFFSNVKSTSGLYCSKFSKDPRLCLGKTGKIGEHNMNPWTDFSTLTVESNASNVERNGNKKLWVLWL